MTTAADRLLTHDQHMARVHAVHRRSAYERVLNKIRHIQNQPLGTPDEAEQLAHLIELRHLIRAELIEHGQLS